MLRRIFGVIIVSLIVLALFAFPPNARPSEGGSNPSSAIIDAIAGTVASTLTGDALTALGLNVQNSNSAYETDVTSELQTIIDQLNQVNTNLANIKAAIQNQTCIEQLDSTDFSDAVNDIHNVYNNSYLALLNNATNSSYTITQADIDAVISQMGSLADDLNTINTQMQLAGTDGVIGQCSQAFYDALQTGNGTTGLPMSTTLGGDLDFYTPTNNLMQYLAGIQAEGTLLLVEYDDYMAFKSSNYYSSSGVAQNPLTADNAKAVCVTPTSAMTSSQTDYCIDANNQLQQLYAYLQNQFTASGVSYTTFNYDSNGKPTTVKTGVWAGPPSSDPTQQEFLLFVSSLEDFTKAEQPDSGCTFPLQSTSATSPCGITASDTPGIDPFLPVSNQSPYGYVTGWQPATAAEWSTVMAGFNNLPNNTSETAGTYLQKAGFLNTATDTSTNADVSKIIETPDYYEPNPAELGNLPLDYLASPQGGVCFMDTKINHTLSWEPICFNGSNGGSKEYGDANPLLDGYSTFHSDSLVDCLAFSADSMPGQSGDPSFYQGQLYSNLSIGIDGFAEQNVICPGPQVDDYPYWKDNTLPGWAWKGGSSATNHKAFFWPAIHLVNTLACTVTNYAWGVQPAIIREPVNADSIPTMCNQDFDLYFAASVDPVNSFHMFSFLNDPFSGPGGSSATLGPFTIQMQQVTYGDETPKPLTASTDTVVTLSSTSADGVFSLTDGGPAVTTVTIPAGQSEATFYYGDPDAGTPVISASTGAINSAFQNEEILSSFPTSATVGRVDYGKAGHDNGSLRFRGMIQLPKGIKLNQLRLTISHALYEDSGFGELVQGPDSTPLNFPLTLVPARGSTARHAIFETRPGVKPFLTVEIKAKPSGRILYRNNNPGTSEFDVTLLHADIKTPKACTDLMSQVTLHTKLTVGDGKHAPVSFDSQIGWQCVAHGLITPTDSTRNFGGMASLR